MTPEAKKQLEEMAEKDGANFQVPSDSIYDYWMLGAQAAWDLCQKHERERCKELRALLERAAAKFGMICDEPLIKQWLSDYGKLGKW